MKLVNFGKNITAGSASNTKVVQNKTQNKQANLFAASNKTESNDFCAKADFDNFFKGIELLVENDSKSIDDIFSKKINEPDLKFNKPEPKFNLDNAYLEIDNSKLGLLEIDSEPKASKFEGFFA